MSFNITTSTFFFTILQGILGVTASSLQDRHPDIAYWCGYGVAIAGVVLLNIKQFFQPKQ